MNDIKVTKSRVRNDFKHARYLMRLADDAMKEAEYDFEGMESLANELVACMATFEEWIADERDAAEEAADEPNPLAVQVPAGAWDQDVWNAWTR